METIFIKGIPIRKAPAPVQKTAAQSLALTQLQAFIDTKEPQLTKFLHNLWNNQGNAITYKSLREAILAGDLPSEMVAAWQQEYSRFVTEYMLPRWESAFEAAANNLAQKYPKFAFDGTAVGVREWNATNAARFVTNVTTAQIEGLRAVIRRATQLDGMNVDELARVIRPMVGLTHQQTIANLKYYEKLISNGVSEKKAKEMSLKYSARQHRYRGQMIARTELAFSYNQGKYLSVKQAQEQGLMGKCKKVWVMADTERTCSICRALDGKDIDMDEDFDIQTNLTHSAVKKVPPAHPHCMCAIDYVEVERPAADPLPEQLPETDTPEQPPEEEAFPFAPAKTIKEANNYAHDVLGITRADYKGTSIDVANEWNRGLADSFRRFPELKDNFEFVGTCQNRNKVAKKELYPYVMDKFKRANPRLTEAQLDKAVKKYITKNYAPSIAANTYAQSSRTSIVRGVTISDKWQGQYLIDNLKQDVLHKFHPVGCDTVRSILDHEIGHQLDDLLGISTSPEIKKMYHSMIPSEMTDKLSTYSWRNSNPIKEREFVAEAWSEYMNNPEPRETAKKVGEFIEEKYRQFKARQH